PRAGVPVTAAVAVLLVVLAVVVGVTLRARATRPEVVDLAPATRSSARAADAGSSGGALPAGSSTGAGSSPGAGVSTGDGAGQAVGGPGGAGSGAVAVVGATGVRASGAGPAASAPVVVDVVGKVRRPGLVRLPPGSRVADAVAAAGGPTDAAALARINLARVLADGEQVVVPDADDPLPALPAAPAATSGPGGAARPSGPLDLNTATAADLDELPGVGPVLAGRIVEWRSQHQRFTRVDELAEVAGIGDKVLERLRPLVAV
uniref:ComEA family DNA-binding protein n=1 Tax=Kineosporia sp. R_H_3 TaxID=1961848 RepID=UPI001E3D8C4A